MAINISTISTALGISVAVDGSGKAATKKLNVTEQQLAFICEHVKQDMLTVKPNSGRLGGDVEIVFIRGG